jgi:hypothetical protein
MGKAMQEVDADAIATMWDLLKFCSQPTTDCLLRIESEGGRVWEFDAKQFLLVISGAPIRRAAAGTPSPEAPSDG